MDLLQKEYSLGNLLTCTPGLDARKIYTSPITTPNNNICFPVEEAGYAMGLVLLADGNRPEASHNCIWTGDIPFLREISTQSGIQRQGARIYMGQCAEELAKMYFDDDLDSIGIAESCVIRDENHIPIGIGNKVANPSLMLIYCMVNYHLSKLESLQMTREELVHSSLEDATVKSFSIIKAIMAPSLVRRYPLESARINRGPLRRHT